jgi:hypothetical protein
MGNRSRPAQVGWLRGSAAISEGRLFDPSLSTIRDQATAARPEVSRIPGSLPWD